MHVLLTKLLDTIGIFDQKETVSNRYATFIESNINYLLKLTAMDRF